MDNEEDKLTVAEEDIPVLVKDYIGLIETLHTGERPTQIVLDEYDANLVTVDDIEYDLSDIPHDDQLNTGRRMEIEELLYGGYGDLPISEVEAILNKQIQEEWQGRV